MHDIGLLTPPGRSPAYRRAVPLALAPFALALVTGLVATSATAQQETVAATIDSLGVASEPGPDGTYVTGDVIRIAVGFDAAVTVRGTPSLTIDIAGNPRAAAYDNGSGTQSLTFAYTVQAADRDLHGISIAPGRLALNGGAILGAGTLAASLDHPGLPRQPAHRVNAGPNVITGVNVTSVPSGGPADSPRTVYIIGDPITVEVSFSQALGPVGSPTLDIRLGATSGSGDARQADCRPGAGTTLVCTYIVQEGDSGDGVNVESHALTGSNLPAINNPATTVTHEHDIDGARLAVHQVSVTPPEGPGWGAGSTIGVTLAFTADEPAYRTGFGVSLVLDSGERPMTYTQDDDDATLAFEYEVRPGDNAKEFRLRVVGVERLRDANGNAGFAAGEDINRKFADGLARGVRRVDTLGPRVTGLRIDSTPVGSAYKSGEVMRFVLDFDEQLHRTISGVSLDVTVGTGTFSARCGRATSGRSLTCSLTVLAGWLDTDGVSTVANALAFASGGLTDDLGNIAVNRFPAKRFPEHMVDAVAPTVTRAALVVPSARVGNNVVVRLTFSEPVFVSGDPTVTLGIEDGNGSATAVYARTSSNVVEFRYSLTAGDVDGYDGVVNGDYDRDVTIGGFTVAGVADAAGNPWATTPSTGLPKGSLRLLAVHTDTTAPRLEQSSLRKGGRFGAGQAIRVDVLFSEPVTLSNATLKLRIGGRDVTNPPRPANPGPSARHTFTHTAASPETGRVSVSEITLAGDGTVLDPSGHGFANRELNEDERATLRSVSRIPTSLSGATADVDTEAPTVVSVAFLAEPGPTATGDDDGRRYYGKNAKIWIEIVMSEAVRVAGDLTIVLDVHGDTGAAATYLRERSSATKLVFEYSVPEGDVRDTDGIAVAPDTAPSPNDAVTDLAGNQATFTHAGTFSALHRVDASLDGGNQGLVPVGEPDEPAGRTPATVSPARRPDADCTGDCGEGDRLTITIPMDPPVSYTEAPQLILGFEQGGSRRLNASPASGEAVRTLTFSYRIEDGDEDLDGVEVELVGNFTLDDGRPAPRSTTLDLPRSIRVDARPPRIESIEIASNPGSDDTYVLGDAIEIAVTFTEPVEFAPGTDASLQIDIGGNRRTAALRSPSAGAAAATYRFRYEVAEGDTDPDGISIPPLAGAGLGVTLRDASELEARIAHPGVGDDDGHRVDTVGPTVTDLVLSGRDALLREGDAVVVTVSFDEDVDVATGGASAARLALMIGDATRLATYVRGDGSPTLVFEYTVAEGDNGTISVGVDAFAGEVADAGGNPASIPTVFAFADYIVDALAPRTGTPRITTDPGADGYIPGDTIRVLVPFDEPVRVTPTDRGPRVALFIGGVRRFAVYEGGSGTLDLTFTYQVVPGDVDADGIAVGNNVDPWMQFVGSSIRDFSGLEVVRSSAAVYFNQHTVRPAVGVTTVTVVSDPGADGTYITGDTIRVAVAFQEAVTARGAPQLAIDIGDGQVMATYAGGSGSDTLVFAYTVRTGERDLDGISVRADALERGGAGLVDADGLRVYRQHPALADQADHKVDAVPAVVTGAALVSDPGDDGIYILGDTIELEVTFSKAVTVTGGPTLGVTVGGETRAAAVASGSGTGALVLAYTVQAGDLDEDGISVQANAFDLDGGAIEDANGLAARLDHAAIADLPEHRVDGTAPAITGVEITSSPATGDAYDAGETIAVAVTFGEPVRVSGSPALALRIGLDSRDAACRAAAPSTLRCAYEVAPSDFDADGVSVEANSLAGGEVTDVPGNAAARAHAAIADQPGHKVHAARPMAAGTLPDVSLVAGEVRTVSLAGTFTGFAPVYGAEASDTSVATVELSGLAVTVTAGAEGSATVTVTATNAGGSAAVAFEVTVTTDPIEKAVLDDALAAIGRSMLSGAAHIIGSRLDLASHAAALAVGGQRFSPRPFAGDPARLWHGEPPGTRRRTGRSRPDGPLTSERLFGGTAFNLPLNAAAPGLSGFALWGAGDLSSFEGQPDRGTYEGGATAGYLGVDARGDGWLAGVSVSRHGAEADYDFGGTVDGGGTLETAVTSFHPYARMDLGRHSEVWVIGGFGSGTADLTRSHLGEATESSDLSMAMVIGGLERALETELAVLRGATLSVRGDAGFLSLETDSGDRAVDGLSASVTRLRVGVEASWDVGGTTPFAEVASRFDGGDGQAGSGIELGAGLRHAIPAYGLALEAKARVLAMHTGEGYRESGFGATATFEPGTAGRGVTFRLAPRWGGSADGTDLFWNEHGGIRDAARHGLRRHARTWGVDAALGYGFDLRSIPGLVTPFSQVDVTGSHDRRIRFGIRYGLQLGPLGATRFEVSAEQADGDHHPVPDRRVLLSGEARF